LLFGVKNTDWIAALLSIAVIILAGAVWKDLDSGFAAALLAGLLVSYHLNWQDLTLALIPLFLAVKRLSARALFIVIICSIALPWILVVTGGFALLAVPLTVALVWVGSWYSNPRPDLDSGSRGNEGEPSGSKKSQGS
jgi:hypothetical protein